MPLGVKVAEPLALVLCLLLFTGGSVHAQPDEEQTITYGDLYLADDLDTLGNRHRVGVGAGYETGNRLLNVFHLQLKYTYQLTELFGLGVLGRTFSFAPTALNRRVDEEFSLIGLESETQGPHWSGYFFVSVSPIRGRVNFFSLRAIPVSINLNIGPGVRNRGSQESQDSMYWSLSNHIDLTDRMGLVLAFSQEIEDVWRSTSIPRSQINASLEVAL